MFYKTPDELKVIAKTGIADDAVFASSIIQAIIKKKPDDFLRKHKDRLIEFFHIYEKYKNRKREFLNEKLNDILSMPAIESIIILHIIRTIQSGESKVEWPVLRNKFTGLPAFILPLDIMEKEVEKIVNPKVKNIIEQIIKICNNAKK